MAKGILLFFNLIPFLTFSQNPDFDVRSLRWGMTKAQVLAAEKKKPVNDEPTYMYFRDIIAGVDTMDAGYTFNNKGRLSQAWIHIKSSTSCVARFRAIDSILEEKQGKPVDKSELWINEKHRQKGVDGWCDAVREGHLGLTTEWSTEHSDIKHYLMRGTHDNVAHEIYYTSKKIKQPVSKSGKDY